MQLFGSDPDIVSEMAAQVEVGPYAWIDLNMGCPVPKVVNNGEGSALIKSAGLQAPHPLFSVSSIRYLLSQEEDPVKKLQRLQKLTFPDK